MSGISVRVDGAVEEILTRLVEVGFFKTKAEALRAGILLLGNRYGAVKSRKELIGELAIAKFQTLKRRYPEIDWFKVLSATREDSAKQRKLLDELTKNSKVTEADIEQLAALIKHGVAAWHEK